jgi:hypothetical protein
MSRRHIAPINHTSAPGMGQRLEGRKNGGKDRAYTPKDVLNGTIHDINAYQAATERRQKRAEKRLAREGK